MLSMSDINETRSTLTELLNREGVRNDGKMRLLVQTKLMEAELAAKEQRRRRISPPSIIVTASETPA